MTKRMLGTVSICDVLVKQCAACDIARMHRLAAMRPHRYRGSSPTTREIRSPSTLWRNSPTRESRRVEVLLEPAHLTVRHLENETGRNANRPTSWLEPEMKVVLLHET